MIRCQYYVFVSLWCFNVDLFILFSHFFIGSTHGYSFMGRSFVLFVWRNKGVFLNNCISYTIITIVADAQMDGLVKGLRKREGRHTERFRGSTTFFVFPTKDGKGMPVKSFVLECPMMISLKLSPGVFMALYRASLEHHLWEKWRIRNNGEVGNDVVNTLRQGIVLEILTPEILVFPSHARLYWRILVQIVDKLLGFLEYKRYQCRCHRSFHFRE